MNVANTHNEARSSTETRQDRRPEPVCPAPADCLAGSQRPSGEAGTAEQSLIAVLGYN